MQLLRDLNIFSLSFERKERQARLILCLDLIS
jgi:hypothetical protein